MRRGPDEQNLLYQRFGRLQEKFQAQELSHADIRLLCGAPCLKEAVEKHTHPSQSEVQQVLAGLQSNPGLHHCHTEHVLSAQQRSSPARTSSPCLAFGFL